MCFSKLEGIDPASVSQGWGNLDKVEKRHRHTHTHTRNRARTHLVIFGMQVHIFAVSQVSLNGTFIFVLFLFRLYLYSHLSACVPNLPLISLLVSLLCVFRCSPGQMTDNINHINCEGSLKVSYSAKFNLPVFSNNDMYLQPVSELPANDPSIHPSLLLVAQLFRKCVLKHTVL